MTDPATTLAVGGQLFTVKGRREDIAATVKAGALRADLRDFQTTDGDWVTVNTATVATITEATTKTRRVVGFLRGETCGSS